MGFKQLFLASFILVLIQFWCCNCCWEVERVALLELQSSFNISWFSFKKTANCCDWYGVGCDAHTGRVTHIDLWGARCSDMGDWYLNNWTVIDIDLSYKGDWYLNTSLFLPFKQLTSLYLSFNQITGCLQNEGFERLTELNKLKYLYLSYNNFNNNIISSLSGLLFLETLDISYNNLNGSINLEELASLKNLEELRLSGNKNISEFVVPKDVRVRPNLKTIYLDDMKDNGMPLLLKSLTPFSSLKTLYLQENNLSEASFIHDSQSFKSLEILYLNSSVVDDNFFHSLNALSSLKSLSFQDGYGLNNLQGLCNLNLNYLQSLDLGNNNLSGGLSPCLSNFTSLQHLDLSFNNLNGEYYGLNNLQGLCNLKSSYLQFLDLSSNNVTGNLPSCLSNFTFLQYLDLSNNSFVGNLSSSPLTLMNSIQHLDLQGNNFQIPISLVPFYNSSNLSYLDISGNELYAETEWHNFIPRFQLEELYMIGDGCGGSFPRFLYSQANLQSVDLSDNKMGGEFPQWLIENNTRLEELHLSNNSLTGTIKLSARSHVNLINLDVSSNFFSGQFPTNFGSYFPNLEYLDLSINHLSGELPNVLNFSSLNIFDMSKNNISGSLPIFSSSTLREVYLAKNNLHGSLSWAFSNSSYLSILVVNHNSLTGNIPQYFGNLSYLNFLQLAHNYLEGEIPTELCMLDDLLFVDLSNNNLSGEILPCVKIRCHDHGRFFPTRSIEFTTKSFSYSYQGIALVLLSGIDLSCNKLIGKIPLEFGNLTKIKALNLSHNNLRGSIPSTFSNLEDMECLDLSHNHLEGKIPSQIIQLKSISSFSVAYNNLSGKTPDFVNQFATFENTSYEGNLFLCGKPLSKSCEDTISPSPLLGTSTNSEDDDGFMDMDVFNVSFGVSYVMVLLGIVAVLYINPYWRRAWFYFIERKMTNCYYFIVDLFNF